MSKKKRTRGPRAPEARRSHGPPPLRYGINPGVGSLMLINPVHTAPREAKMAKRKRPNAARRQTAAAAAHKSSPVPSVNVNVKTSEHRPAPAAPQSPPRAK